MKSRKFKFIDLFAGIGGFRLALESLGGKCVFSSEWDKYAAMTYKENFGEEPSGDITKIEADIIPSHDVLCAGFPCQAFSICGKQGGFNDARGTMFFEILRIAKEKQPKILFLENVKHLIHHDSKKTFNAMQKHLTELGYIVSWEVLNAKDFGVPQNRERVVIVATKKGLFNFDLIKRGTTPRLKEFLDKENSDSFAYLDKEEYKLISKPVEQESGLIFAGYRNKKIREIGVRPNTEHLSRVHKQPNRIYSTEGTHPALPSQESSGRFFILHQNKVRKLTINECFRLMGFPEAFKKPVPASEQYRQVGNSVCVPMIKTVGEAIIKQLL